MKIFSILLIVFFAGAVGAQDQMSTPTPAPTKSMSAPRTYLPNMKKLKKKSSSEKPADKPAVKCNNEEGKSIIPGDADYDAKCSGASM